MMDATGEGTRVRYPPPSSHSQEDGSDSASNLLGRDAMKTKMLALLVSISLCAGAARAVEFCELMPVSAQSQYQEVFQPTCHNCYEIDVALQMGARTFKEVLDSVKNVEVDFWDTKNGVGGGVAQEWYVRHSSSTSFPSGNDNNCTSTNG